MKSIVVARVSTEEQREANNSLPAQTERINNYFDKKGFPVIKTFSFDESAYRDKRDEFDKLLEYVQETAKKEKIAVGFDKVDRLSRSVFDKRIGTLYEMAVADRIELHFVSDGQVINNQMSAVEKFQFGMSLGLAKYYSDAIGDNVKRAFEQKRRNGEWTGPVRVGYKNVSLDEEKRLRKDIVIDESCAHLVQKIFELYATGNYSLATIREKITAMGLRSKDDNKLSKSNFELILNDPFYCGTAVSKKHGSWIHKYPRLITRELFEKCQEVRKGRGKMRSKLASADFIFKGLLRCKKCGCMMSPEVHRKKSGLVFVYYSCTNSKGICKRDYISEKALLEPVYDVFKAFESIPQDVQDKLVEELRGLNESEVKFHQQEIKRIRAEYDRFQKQIDKLMDLLLDESITKVDYDKKLKELKDKQYHLGIELEEYTKADHDYHIHVSTVFNLSKKIKALFESSEPMEKRAILNYLIQNPTVSEKKLSFSLRSPFNLILELSSSNLAPISGRVQNSYINKFKSLNWVSIMKEFDSLSLLLPDLALHQ